GTRNGPGRDHSIFTRNIATISGRPNTEGKHQTIVRVGRLDQRAGNVWSGHRRRIDNRTADAPNLVKSRTTKSFSRGEAAENPEAGRLAASRGRVEPQRGCERPGFDESFSDKRTFPGRSSQWFPACEFLSRGPHQPHAHGLEGTAPS